MFQFEFEIENTDTAIVVMASTYKEAMQKIQTAKIPALNLAELVLMRMHEIERIQFRLDPEELIYE
jgi:hypothetical protein